MATEKTKKAPAAKKKPSTKKTEAAPASDPVTRKFQDYTIIKKRSGRFEVLGLNGQNVNGMDKAKVLVEAKLIKTGLGKKEVPAAESTEEAAAPAAE